MQFIYTGSTPDVLDCGQPVALGDVVELTATELEQNARLLPALQLAKKHRRKPQQEES